MSPMDHAAVHRDAAAHDAEHRDDVPSGEEPTTPIGADSGRDRSDRVSWYRNEHVLYRLVAALTVIPILVAAVRDGLHGWVSVMDEAHTVIAARFALGSDPWLLGIFTDASVWIDHAAFFPGPWWLWMMSIAIRLFGTTWGPLLSIAGLNVIWILLAGWSVKRRLGPRAAMGALVFLGMLTWALGASVFHSPSGQVMIVPVIAAFFFVAWAFAAGDEGVLWALALITNFIVLDEVVAIRLAPVVALAAVVVWGLGLYRLRRRRIDDWPLVRRRSIRAVIAAGVITVVMWIPTLIQQFTHDPGNLTNLWRAFRAQPDEPAIWGRAFGAIVSFFAGPPFWLRGSRNTNYLVYGVPPATGVQIVVGLVLVGAVVGLGWSAWRRQDRPAFSVLVMGTVVFFTAWYNLANPANPTGATTYVGYYLSVWAVVMFMTFAIVFAFVRALPKRLMTARPYVALGGAAVLFALNLPHANFTLGTYASSDGMISTAHELDVEVLAAVEGRGRVAIAKSRILGSPYLSSLGVELNDAGVPICLYNHVQPPSVAIPLCTEVPFDVTIHVYRVADTPPSHRKGGIIARHDPLTAAEHRELRRLTAKVTDAVAAAPPLRLTSRYQRDMSSTMPAGASRERLINPPFLADPMATPQSRTQFAQLVAKGSAGEKSRIPVHVQGLSDGDLLRWGQLEARRYDFTIVVTMTDASQR